MKCAAGYEVPPKGRCTICGAAPKSKCLKNIKDRQAEIHRQWVKEAADRAELRSAKSAP